MRWSGSGGCYAGLFCMCLLILLHPMLILLLFSLAIYLNFKNSFSTTKLITNASVCQNRVLSWPPLLAQRADVLGRGHPLGCSPPGSSVRAIFQARILESVAISFSMYSLNTTQLLSSGKPGKSYLTYLSLTSPTFSHKVTRFFTLVISTNSYSIRHWCSSGLPLYLCYLIFNTCSFLLLSILYKHLPEAERNTFFVYLWILSHLPTFKKYMLKVYFPDSQR